MHPCYHGITLEISFVNRNCKGWRSLYLNAHTNMKFIDSYFRVKAAEHTTTSLNLLFNYIRKHHSKFHGSPNHTRVCLTSIHPLLHGTNSIERVGFGKRSRAKSKGMTGEGNHRLILRPHHRHLHKT